MSLPRPDVGDAIGCDDARAPTISIIMIFLDEERFLPDAVASVEQQTCDDWELLLVDDGSTDGSAAMAHELALAEPERIRYLSHADGRNYGMSASRNLGMANARGRWITFLDADDIWLPDKLASQLALLAGNPGVEALASPALWWWSWDVANDGPVDWIQSLGIAGTTVVEPPVLLRQFVDDEWMSICDLVISRRAALDVGGYEESFAGMFEDQVFHAKVFARYRSVVTEQWWYRYRQHQQATTARAHASGAHDAARRRFLDWLSAYLAGTGDTSVDDALRRRVGHHQRRYRYPRLWRIAQAGRRAVGPLR